MRYSEATCVLHKHEAWKAADRGRCCSVRAPARRTNRRVRTPRLRAMFRERRAGRACHLLLCVVIAGTVADDDWIGLLNGPWRREAALGHKRRDGPGLHERELPNHPVTSLKQT